MDELDEALPITHILLLLADDNLPSAPYTVVGKLDPSDEGYSHGPMLTAMTFKDRKTIRKDWRKRRSISLIRFGRLVVKVVRVAKQSASVDGNHLH
ncbi:MAG: hypothetical protein ACKPKO_62480, partial [Candidatus Fonsibacter sp.]